MFQLHESMRPHVFIAAVLMQCIASRGVACIMNCITIEYSCSDGQSENGTNSKDRRSLNLYTTHVQGYFYKMAAPREENQRIDPSIIKSTRSVLLSTSHGLPLKNFTRDYKVLVKSDFPFRECGYSSAMEMLRDMEGIGVVRFAEGKDGTSHLYGVADKGCFMPSWVKKAQVPGNHGSGGAHQQQRRRGRGSGVMRRSAYVSDKQPGIVEPSSSNRKQNQPAGE